MRRILPVLTAVLGVLVAGCAYGFAGGGLPRHVRTVAVIPFENQTPLPELQREINDALRIGLEQRLGLRDAAEDRADAVVRGTIVRFEPDVPVAFSADAARSSSVRRRMQIVLDVEIFDQVSGRVLWEKKGLSAEGEYSERQEAAGRKQAIDRIVADVIEGAQSQW
ncbi:MAG: DUF4136 domain-containing protein [Gemmatimonadaceae bacterium]|nr:DUF4136 domain-containing protein [Gemmatimonadaceae bacterium]